MKIQLSPRRCTLQLACLFRQLGTISPWMRCDIWEARGAIDESRAWRVVVWLCHLLVDLG
jgi:hypothetical protein